MKADVILCPVDFSEASRHAARYAVALADRSGARLIGLHVHQPALAAIAVGVGRDDPVVQRTSDASPEIRRRIASQFGETSVDRVAPEIAAGSPADTIADRARSARADLIVIGTRGASGPQHLLLGSVTEEVIRKSGTAVLAIPPRAPASPMLPFERILFATDFSAASLAAMEAALRMLMDDGSSATVLHVIDDPAEHVLFLARPYDVHHHAEALERHVADSLAQLTEKRFEGRQAPVLRLAHGRPAAGILAVAEEIDADLVVMGVHGRKALDVAVFGSTTNEVVRKAACPVLAARG